MVLFIPLIIILSMGFISCFNCCKNNINETNSRITLYNDLHIDDFDNSSDIIENPPPYSET